MERLTMRDETGVAFWVDRNCVGGGYRMTEDKKDQARLDRLAAYEDFMGFWRLRDLEEAGRIFRRVNALDSTDLMAQYRDLGPIDHLRELAQAEKYGRLVVLPCKVGDTVYEANKRGFVSTYKVISVHISDCSVLIGWELMDGIYSNLNGFEVSALGKTVFLTREEAEAALKG